LRTISSITPRVSPASASAADRAARELAALLATPDLVTLSSTIATRVRAEPGAAGACAALEAQLR
jgi:hypothetical protein